VKFVGDVSAVLFKRSILLAVGDTSYREQDRLSGTSSLFSVITVAISGMGLFSITAYSIRLRQKEISIRKVLGASVTSIILKLSRVYGAMIIIGFMVACPIVYSVGNSFLSKFAHRIQLSAMVFVGVGILIFTLAMLIVGWLSGKAALENPVNSLKED
jgi:putative ABC transport system permease protein